MKNQVIFHPHIKTDVERAARYYEAARRGYGRKFATVFRKKMGFVRRHPRAGHPLFDYFRHFTLPPFPYAVAYSEAKATTLVLAVLDMRRDPAANQARLSRRRDDLTSHADTATVAASLLSPRTDEEGDHRRAAA
ncbi:MAG: type II toxin-antitoxin system RelE/ParE family toxin [Bifidobacteriaceae bacterium]|nr:type II toxin-antitoxin system RelE/ParE family toxin [Bifidobacteriaceae bacterium]